MTQLLPSLWAILLLLTLASHCTAADEPALWLYCNATGPCRACKPAKLRTDPDCKETGFSSRLACVVGVKGQDISHEYGRELDPDQTTLKEGKRVSWQHSCQPPGGLSFVGFEGTVLAVLLLAYVVMMRRKRALQRL